MVKHCLFKILVIAILFVATTTQTAFAQQPTTTTRPSPTPQFNLNTIPAASNETGSVTTQNPSSFPVSLSLTVESTTNNMIIGTLNFQNGFLDDIPNFYYQVNLFPKKTSSNISGLVTYTISKPTYTAKSKTTQSIPFQLAYSQAIPPGDYELQAFVGTANKPILANTSESITLSGNDTYIDVVPGSCVVIANNTSYEPGIAAPFNPGETPTGRCTLVNKQNRAVTVTTNTDYAVRFITANPGVQITKVSSNTPISFQPNEQKQVTLSLPALTTPQVYQAFMTLVNENNTVVSTIIPFRWTVKGPSAYISTVKLNNNYFKDGATADIVVGVSSSMDLFWQGRIAEVGTELQQAVLSATIYDAQGTVCGTKEQPLPELEKDSIVWPAQIIPVPITKECVNPKAEVKLVSDGKTLAEKTVQTLTPVTDTASSQKPWYTNPLLLGVLGLLVVVIITSIIIFLRKRHKKPPLEVPPAAPLVILLVLSAMFLFGSSSFLQKVFALTIYPYTFDRATSGSPTPYYFRYFDGACTEDGCDDGINQKIDVTGQLWVHGTGDFSNHGVILQGDFWTPGSQVRTLSADTVEVTFFGEVFDISCGNFAAGFLLESFINGETKDTEISNITMLSDGNWQTRNARGWTGVSVPSGGDTRLGPTNINVSRDGGSGGGPIQIKFHVKKTTGAFGPQDTFNLNANLYLARNEGKFYSSSDDNQPVVEASPNGPQSAFCGGRDGSGNGIPGCIGRADIPIPGGYLEGVNNISCTVSGWAALPATQYPSSGRKQADVEIWSFSSNPPTLVKRFTPNTNRTDLGGRFGFSENLNGLLANNQQYNLGIYAVQGNGSDKLWTGLVPINQTSNPITITCTNRPGTPTPTPRQTACITPGPGTPPPFEPSLNVLLVDPGRDGVGPTPGRNTAKYGVSGLNKADPNLTPGVSGDNYFNTLKIQPIVNSNGIRNDQVELVASAFTKKGDPLVENVSNPSLSTLVNSAKNGNGFVTVYANKTVDVDGFHFDANNYYLIYNNTLSAPLEQEDFTPIKSGTKTIISAAISKPRGDIPWTPSFDVTLYQPLGNQVWGTYIYLKTDNTTLSAQRNPLSALSAANALNSAPICSTGQ